MAGIRIMKNSGLGRQTPLFSVSIPTPRQLLRHKPIVGKVYSETDAMLKGGQENVLFSEMAIDFGTLWKNCDDLAPSAGIKPNGADLLQQELGDYLLSIVLLDGVNYGDPKIRISLRRNTRDNPSQRVVELVINKLGLQPDNSRTVPPGPDLEIHYNLECKMPRALRFEATAFLLLLLFELVEDDVEMEQHLDEYMASFQSVAN